MVSERPAGLHLKSRKSSWPTAVGISVKSTAVNPSFVARTVYTDGFKFGIRKVPESTVVVDRSSPVLWFFTETTAPATKAPVLSRTVPANRPSLCAADGIGTENANRVAATHTRNLIAPPGLVGAAYSAKMMAL